MFKQVQEYFCLRQHKTKLRRKVAQVLTNAVADQVKYSVRGSAKEFDGEDASWSNARQQIRALGIPITGERQALLEILYNTTTHTIQNVTDTHCWRLQQIEARLGFAQANFDDASEKTSLANRELLGTMESSVQAALSGQDAPQAASPTTEAKPIPQTELTIVRAKVTRNQYSCIFLMFLSTLIVLVEGTLTATYLHREMSVEGTPELFLALQNGQFRLGALQSIVSASGTVALLTAAFHTLTRKIEGSGKEDQGKRAWVNWRLVGPGLLVLGISAALLLIRQSGAQSDSAWLSLLADPGAWLVVLGMLGLSGIAAVLWNTAQEKQKQEAIVHLQTRISQMESEMARNRDNLRTADVGILRAARDRQKDILRKTETLKPLQRIVSKSEAKSKTCHKAKERIFIQIGKDVRSELKGHIHFTAGEIILAPDSEPIYHSHETYVRRTNSGMMPIHVPEDDQANTLQVVVKNGVH